MKNKQILGQAKKRQEYPDVLCYTRKYTRRSAPILAGQSTAAATHPLLLPTRKKQNDPVQMNISLKVSFIVAKPLPSSICLFSFLV